MPLLVIEWVAVEEVGRYLLELIESDNLSPSEGLQFAVHSLLDMQHIGSV